MDSTSCCVKDTGEQEVNRKITPLSPHCFEPQESVAAPPPGIRPCLKLQFTECTNIVPVTVCEIQIKHKMFPKGNISENISLRLSSFRSVALYLLLL